MEASEARDPGAGRRSRVFFALDPPAATVEAIAGWQRRALHGRESVRAIDAGALHLTLAFLGDRDGAEVERAEGVLAGLGATGPVAVRLAPEPVGLPGRRPRVIAFDAASEAAVALREQLVAAGLLGQRGEGRPFRPHLSVARIRGDPRERRSRRAALDGLPPLPPGEGHTFDAVRVALYRSELRSQGARYSVLADVELPRGSGG